MAINRALEVSQLLPGLNAVLGNHYKSIDNEHRQIFSTEKSNRSFEEEVNLAGLGAASVKQEGAPVEYEDMQETWKARYIHETIAKAFAITEEAVEDNLYDTFTKVRAAALGRSMAATKQTKAANVLNFGFTAGYTGGDGVPLFSSAHPVVTGSNQSNTATAQLSETALEQAEIAVSLFKDEKGILIGSRAKRLIIPPALKFQCFQILRSDLSTTTATNSTTGVTNVNDVNALRAGGYFPGGHAINHRLTDTRAWFIITDVPHGLKMFERKGLMTAMDGDFDTGNVKYKARERYSFGWTDWRGVYGSSGSA